MTITPNAAPLPSAMPRKANPLHQQILGALLETKKVSRKHKSLQEIPNDKPIIVETTVTGETLRFPLAQNVSGLNVDRAAKRWLR
ncbi:hypotheical protein [Mycobacterium phage PP]|uniref:Hypotheical protein n=1 Tax=Mycobacterium phage PP TaxID=2077134 RepID=A0A2Z5XVK7_9CAUD|nr:hypothetical protein KIW36_gp30 [Mycobacterium phage PP]BBC53861.1 hypotheical protein [Mycobacterium phage PP]